MTVKQVRDNFIQNLAENAYLNMCTTEEMKVVISALERQVPKSPTNVIRLKAREPYFIGLCPICREENCDEFSYCGICGQALDWSDVK